MAILDKAEVRTLLSLTDRELTHQSMIILNPFLSAHRDVILDRIHNRAIVQYVEPFSDVRLDMMSAAFGMSPSEMLAEVETLIGRGDIKGRIDLIDMVRRAGLRCSRSAYRRRSCISERRISDLSCTAMPSRPARTPRAFLWRLSYECGCPLNLCRGCSGLITRQEAGIIVDSRPAQSASTGGPGPNDVLGLEDGQMNGASTPSGPSMIAQALSM